MHQTYSKMEKKKKIISSLSIILLIWFGFIFTLGIFILFLIYQDPITFSISIPNGQNIFKGESLNLTYKISNYWIQPIENLSMTIWIEGQEGYMKSYNLISPSIFKLTEGEYDRKVNLNEGTYRVFANITYVNKNDEVQSKELSLEFNVKLESGGVKNQKSIPIITIIPPAES